MAQIEHLEHLVLRAAQREIYGFIPSVLERLANVPAINGFDGDSWIRANQSAGPSFLEQLFRARHEHDYVHWQDGFERVIQQECQRVIGEAETWNSLQFDLILEASSTEEWKGKVEVPSTAERWSTRLLFETVLDELMEGDMDTVRERGISVLGGHFTEEQE
ncbi:hypothetical protein [Paracoccus marcusii]|uniref:hypothetical protein n=1 Tax=Paracoccus marcusii TaxID=59779 RepID=UPI0032650AFB